MTTAELLEHAVAVTFKRKQGSFHLHPPIAGDHEHADDYQAHSAWHESKSRVVWADGYGPTIDAAVRDLLRAMGEEVPE